MQLGIVRVRGKGRAIDLVDHVLIIDQRRE